MTRFSVPDMTCGGCVKAITAAVQGEDAAAEVVADLEVRQVVITSRLGDAALVGAMEEAGFTPSLVAA